MVKIGEIMEVKQEKAMAKGKIEFQEIKKLNQYLFPEGKPIIFKLKQAEKIVIPSGKTNYKYYIELYEDKTEWLDRHSAAFSPR